MSKPESVCVEAVCQVEDDPPVPGFRVQAEYVMRYSTLVVASAPVVPFIDTEVVEDAVGPEAKVAGLGVGASASLRVVVPEMETGAVPLTLPGERVISDREVISSSIVWPSGVLEETSTSA